MYFSYEKPKSSGSD